jgi:hypothetical protein
MEENKTVKSEVTKSTTSAAKKTVTKAKIEEAANASKSDVKLATQVTKPANKKVVAKATTAVKPKKVAAKQKVEETKPVEPIVVEATAASKIESAKGSNAVSGIKKVLATGMAAGEIVKTAGSAILDSSIETTKAIAGIYKKAGKKAIELGQNAIGETVMIAMKNQKKVVKTGKKAIKDTVDTIKEADLISNPLKKGK